MMKLIYNNRNLITGLLFALAAVLIFMIRKTWMHVDKDESPEMYRYSKIKQGKSFWLAFIGSVIMAIVYLAKSL